MKSFRPTKAQLKAAVNLRVPDVIGPGLQILFCGINPGLYSAAIGHHFGRPGNRFYPALFGAGLTSKLFSPFEDQDLPALGLGITNFVERASASADELTPVELTAGGQTLLAKVGKYQPKILAILGVGAYRAAFAQPKAQVGPQAEMIGGARLWVLPNPSGLNAHFRLPDIIAYFIRLKADVEDDSRAT